MLSSSSNSKSFPKTKIESESTSTENKIISKANEFVKNKEGIINNHINMLQKQLNENINYINDI